MTDALRQNFMAEYGERLIDNGYSIIPVAPGTKAPGRYTSNEWQGYRDWSRHCDRDTKTLEWEIWKRWPGCGIGIAGGSVVGIDIDLLDADVAFKIETLAREMLGDTPALRIGLAPKRMLVYRSDAPFKGFKRHPIEVLARGQQFLAFAIHPTTQKPYEWPSESLVELHISQLPVVTESKAREFVEAAVKLVPEHLLPKTLSKVGDGTPSFKGASDLRGTLAAVTDALNFISNDDLDYDSWMRIGMALKGALGDSGADLFYRWSALSKKNAHETTEKAWDSFRPTRIGAGSIYFLAEERGWVPAPALILNAAEAELTAAPGPHPAAQFLATITTPQPQAMALAAPSVARSKPAYSVSADLYDVDGGVGQLARWITMTARVPQPFLAVGASLAALGTLMGRRYETPSGLRSNLYSLCIADSGGGKDHARKMIRRLFTKAGLTDYLGGDDFASGSGMLAAMQRFPAQLFQVDEFGRHVSSILGKRAPAHKAEIWTHLMTLYTSSGDIAKGQEYANQKERPRQDLKQVCLSIHATTVGGSFWKAMESSSIGDGSLARWLVFQTDNDYPDWNRNPASYNVPDGLIAMAKAIAAGVPGHDYGGNIANANPMAPDLEPIPYTVPYADDAAARADQLMDDQQAWLRSIAGNPGGAIVARYQENALKLALVRSVAKNPAAPVITLDDLTWAAALAEHCVSYMIKNTTSLVADNEVEGQNKKLQALIDDAGAEGITLSALTAKSRWVTGARRKEIIAELLAGGQIAQEIVGEGKAATLVLRGAAS